jgi:hypothetical protein
VAGRASWEEGEWANDCCNLCASAQLPVGVAEEFSATFEVSGGARSIQVHFEASGGGA